MRPRHPCRRQARTGRQAKRRVAPETARTTSIRLRATYWTQKLTGATIRSVPVVECDPGFNSRTAHPVSLKPQRRSCELQVSPNMLLTTLVAVSLLEPAGEIHPAPGVGDGNVNNLLVGRRALGGAVSTSERGFKHALVATIAVALAGSFFMAAEVFASSVSQREVERLQQAEKGFYPQRMRVHPLGLLRLLHDAAAMLIVRRSDYGGIGKIIEYYGPGWAASCWTPISPDFTGTMFKLPPAYNSRSSQRG